MTNPQVWGHSEEGNWIDLSYVTDMALSEDTLVAAVDPAAEVDFSLTYEGFLQSWFRGYYRRYVLSEYYRRYVLSERGLSELSELVPSELEFEYLDSGHYTWGQTDPEYLSADAMTYTAGDEPETRAHP